MQMIIVILSLDDSLYCLSWDWDLSTCCSAVLANFTSVSKLSSYLFHFCLHPKSLQTCVFFFTFPPAERKNMHIFGFQLFNFLTSVFYRCLDPILDYNHHNFFCRELIKSCIYKYKYSTWDKNRISSIVVSLAVSIWYDHLYSLKET